MIFRTATLLFLSSVVMLIALFRLKSKRVKWLDEEMFYPLGRLTIALFGVSVVLFGLSSFRAVWWGAAFLGVLFIAIGTQIVLWAVGISSVWLGNEPIGSNAASDRAMLYDAMLSEEQAFGRRAFEDEHYAVLKDRLESQFESVLRATEEQSKQLKTSVQTSVEELNRSVERLKTTVESCLLGLKPIRVEANKNFYRAIHRHLTVAISVLTKAKKDSEKENEEMVQTFRSEIAEIRSIINVNKELSSQPEFSEISALFLEYTGVFLFDPLPEAAKQIAVLREFAARAKDQGSLIT